MMKSCQRCKIEYPDEMIKNYDFCILCLEETKKIKDFPDPYHIPVYEVRARRWFCNIM